MNASPAPERKNVECRESSFVQPYGGIITEPYTYTILYGFYRFATGYLYDSGAVAAGQQSFQEWFTGYPERIEIVRTEQFTAFVVGKVPWALSERSARSMSTFARFWVRIIGKNKECR